MSNFLEAQRLSMILRMIKKNPNITKEEAHDYYPEDEKLNSYTEAEIQKMKQTLKEMAPMGAQGQVGLRTI